MIQMKFVYKTGDFSSLEEGEKNCWLLANGLGGYMSATALFSVNRCDAGFLVAAERAPNRRAVLVHRLSETLCSEAQTCFLSAQSFADGRPPEDGRACLESFTWDGVPDWTYRANGVTVRRRCAMARGENVSCAVYEIRNASPLPCVLRVVPSFLFAPKGEALAEPPALRMEGPCAVSGDRRVYFRTNGTLTALPPSAEKLAYPYDGRDGRSPSGFAGQCCAVSLAVESGRVRTLELVCSATPDPPSGRAVLEACAERQDQLCRASPFSHPAARELARSADAFLVRRESGLSLLAGYPFFGDWGRDAMIALPGCALSVGRFDEAKSILRTFLACEKDGLIPNLFPDGEDAPAYNTADAALLLFHCVWLYYRKTGDADFVREAWPVMRRIVDAYRRGTRFHISMDEDGLIRAGAGLEQVTWMDVRIGEFLPTPRHGKPVEINAFWYNALRVLQKLAPLAGENPREYAALARRVKRAFNEKFWMEDRGYLRDVLSGSPREEEQLRCNQIWAVSMPFSILPPRREKAVVEAVFRTLYTSRGLRTLSPDDPDFHPFYGGPQAERDRAYHQGTVWPFPLGAFYLAWLNVHGNTRKAARQVEIMLEPMTSILREGCAGQLPEIYDGGAPGESKGCFAQAWSVGELLRVYERIEAIQNRPENR